MHNCGAAFCREEITIPDRNPENTGLTLQAQHIPEKAEMQFQNFQNFCKLYCKRRF